MSSVTSLPPIKSISVTKDEDNDESLIVAKQGLAVIPPWAVVKSSAYPGMFIFVHILENYIY